MDLASTRNRLEEAFARWSFQVARRPGTIIGLCFLIGVLLALRVPLLSIETSTEDYLFEEDPAKVAFDSFRDQFGRDQPVLLLVEPPEVFSQDFLREIESIHLDLERSVRHLARVTSLYNVRSVYGVGDELLVDDLLETMPADSAALRLLEERVRTTPSYRDTVVSADGRIALFQIEANAFGSAAMPGSPSGLEEDLSGFGDPPAEGSGEVLSGHEIAEFCRDVLDVVERHSESGAALYVTGEPLITYALTRSMAEDVPRMLGAALALIGLLIVAIFRKLQPLLLVGAVVLASLLSTLGLSELLGLPISLPTQILPIFVLAIGVGYSVHLMTLFCGALTPEAEPAAALESALRHVGPPILMTALTTTAGMISFLAAEMQQVVDLGWLSASAVVVTLVYALTLLPALLIWTTRKGRGRVVAGGLEGENALLSACAAMAIRSPRKVVLGVFAASILPISWLADFDVTVNPIKYFPESHWLRAAADFADERAGGMMSLEIVVDTGRENGLHEPEVLARLEALRSLTEVLAAEGEPVGRTASVLEVLKETHQALHENRPAFYAVPDDRELIAQELLLFENSGSDDLERIVDPAFSKARMTLRMPWLDGVDMQQFIHRVTPRIEALFEETEAVQLTGVARMIARISTATTESLVQSYTLALILITPLMIVLIGSLRAGLISMVPNLLPIFIAMGCVVGAGLRFDILMMLGGCIAIGLAVDDSIHFISSFRREYERSGDPAMAVKNTMSTTGRALLFTSIVLVAGFSVLGLSSMANLADLGWMTAGAIALAFLLDITVTPALLVLTHPPIEGIGSSRETGDEHFREGVAQSGRGVEAGR